MAKWLRRLTHKPNVRTAVGSNPALDNLVAVRNSSPGRPEPCEGNLVAAAGSCGGLMVKHPWPLLEISLSDYRRLTTLNINTYLPTSGRARGVLDQILDGDVPSRFQKHTRSLYQIFQNVYPTLYQFFKNIYLTLYQFSENAYPTP